MSKKGSILDRAEKNTGNKRIVMSEGICCANCATGVKSASVDSVSQELIFETEAGSGSSKLKEEVEGGAKKTGPGFRAISEEGVPKAESTENETGEEDEEEEHGKKEIIKLVIGGALFAVGMIFNFPRPVELMVFLLSYAIVGGGVVLEAIRGIARGHVFGEQFLMTVATIGAFFVGEYPEGVAVMLFYLVGGLFEAMALDHSRKSIAALMDIRPDYANLQVDGELKKVSPEDVGIGDIIVVKPGEKIPLDGKVTKGISMVDTSALTGESIPRELAPGSDALSGCINMNGVLTIEVSKEFGESTVSKILDLVQNASSEKAPTEQFITKFARYYTPVVVFAALAIAIIPPTVVRGATFSEWVYRALVFLVVSCPCALVISIPLAFFGGIGGASRKGIMVKGGNYLEALNSVETVVFDKTGTLTKGVFKVTEVSPQNGYSEEGLLENAAYAESHSNHPIALSILNAYGKGIDGDRIEDYEEIAGLGIRVKVDGNEVLAGNAKLMLREQVKYSDDETLGTAVHVAIDGNYVGHIVISDEVKDDSATAIRDLKSLGVKKTVMLTGDTEAVGVKIGRQLGLDEVYAELLPAGKVERLERIESQKSPKGKVVFVGDGINDAPALARADVGVAMGGLGSDAAIEAADVVIMTDEPSKIATAIRIAKKTRSVVVQNIVLALGVKAITLVASAFGLASMWEAVFADMGVALIAIFNAMRVMNTKDT